MELAVEIFLRGKCIETGLDAHQSIPCVIESRFDAFQPIACVLRKRFQ